MHADSLSAGCRGVQNDRRADTNTSGDRSSARLGNAEKCLEFRVGWVVFDAAYRSFIFLFFMESFLYKVMPKILRNDMIYHRKYLQTYSDNNINIYVRAKTFFG